MTTETTKQVIELLGGEKAAQLFDLIAKAKKNSFIGVTKYISGTSNKKCITPKISNITIQLGDMAKKATKDIETVKNMTVESILNGLKGKVEADANFVLECKEIVLNELKNKTLGSESSDEQYQRYRKGQTDAYIYLGDGFKVHKETKEVSFGAYLISENVLQKGVYKPTKSQKKTIVKDWIKRDLLTSKYRQFKLSADLLGSVQISGEKIEF